MTAVKHEGRAMSWKLERFGKNSQFNGPVKCKLNDKIDNKTHHSFLISRKMLSDWEQSYTSSSLISKFKYYLTNTAVSQTTLQKFDG